MSSKLPLSSPKKPWYQDGLRFHCTGCGKCCTGEGGFVFVSDEECTKIAQFLELPLEEFYKKYTRKEDDRRALVDKKENFDCIFLEDKKCSIYPVRPSQCSSFPFWKGHLISKQHWDNLKNYCEGVEHEKSELFSKEEIESRLKRATSTD